MFKDQSAQGIFLYKKLAADFEGKIKRGEFRAGEKLPSLRGLHKKLGLSLSTVYQAYLDLEAAGLIESRPKSGFYVKAEKFLARQAPRHGRRPTKPGPVRLSAITSEVVRASLDSKLIPLGASTLSPELLPHKHLGRILKSLPPLEMRRLLNYAPLEGDPDLRRQLAIRLVGLLPGAGAEGLLITSGCMEAVSLALSLLAKPGEVVAVESPTHFGFLQLIREMGLRAVSVPTDPRLGMDPGALAEVLDAHPVKACLCIANFHNPLGALMPEQNKRELVELCNQRGVPIIEDDIYGELHFGRRRPSLLKSFDKRELVICCSSVSKVLAPGFRVGWCLPGERFGPAMRRLKAASSMASPSLQQAVLARFMAQGAFDRHLRSLRAKVKLQVERTAVAVRHHFPDETRLSPPEGGNMLWIELPAKVDGVKLYREALRQGVSTVPGKAFSATGGFRNFIRVSCTSPFDQRIDAGLALLGKLADPVSIAGQGARGER